MKKFYARVNLNVNKHDDMSCLTIKECTFEIDNIELAKKLNDTGSVETEDYEYFEMELT